MTLLGWFLRNAQKRFVNISKRGTSKVTLPIYPLELISRQIRMLQTPVNPPSTAVSKLLLHLTVGFDHLF